MKNVLLVEDDAWLSDMYTDVMNNCKVIRATTAEEALKAMDKNKIDLIVLDLFLPDHNGMELIHEIASYEDIVETPIIVLSAIAPHDFGLSRARMKQYGIVEYLYKPEVRPSFVAERVNLHLRKLAPLQGDSLQERRG